MRHSIITLLACVLLLVSGATAATTPQSPATSPSTVLTADAVRADFDALYAGLRASHFDLHAHRPRADYEALFRRMRADIRGAMAPIDVWRLFQAFTAYGKVAHARIDPPVASWEAFRQRGGRAFPLFVRVVGGTAHVADDRSGVPGVATGDEIVSIAGKPALQWLRPMLSLVSADTAYLAHAQLETQLPLLAWLAGEDAKSWTVELRKADGRRVELTLPAQDRAGFEAAAAKRSGAFALDWSTREARMLADGTAYLRPGPFYDNRPEATDPWDATAFRSFLDEAFAMFLEKRAKRLLIDLRDNPGGDNSFSDLMIAWFADRPFRFAGRFDIKVSEAAVAANRKRVDAHSGGADSISVKLAAAYARSKPGGHVDFPIPWVAPRKPPRYAGDAYVLVNRHSYSNSVLVAATVQDFGFGAVLGEETADLASTFGALEKFTLPHSGLEVSFPKARILRPGGGTAMRGVVPDAAIPTPLVAVDRDLVLEQALALIASGRHRLADPDGA